ncbi:MAG: hypothetical protein MNPFHGCM_01698 [Gemmatimonadaceae bacterium]|nr:hypothetical protein [Gemmatimonadaceae bacterium]
MADTLRSEFSSGAGASALPGARLLDPRLLARIDSLELLARYVVEGFVSGLHRSPHLGFSTDFAEHRQYMPGDDIRHIDWRLYARTDRFYLKEFEADTNTNFVVLLDASASMAYRGATDGVSKLDYAKYIAACLTYLAHRQRDRVGLVCFRDDVVDYVPPSARHLHTSLHAIDRVTASGKSDLPKVARQVADLQRRRGIVAVLSDFYDSPGALRDAMAPLRDAGHDVLAFHILDRYEIDFPFDESATFEDMETGERLPIVPGRQRAQYTALVRDHLAAVEGLMGEGGVDYLQAVTSKPLDDLLFAYLVRREHLRGMR